MTHFAEIADRVWVARHDWFDVNVTLVAGARGVMVIDTHSSVRAGDTVLEAVRGLGIGDVCAVVNTHAHFDHVLGNAAFRAADPTVPIHATVAAAEEFPAAIARARAAYEADDADPRRDEVLASPAVAPDHLFHSVATLDLGDRFVELVHPGRGHTGGDLVVRVGDADVLIAGDLVEESAPPAFGEDSFPLEWGATMDTVLGMCTPATRVVPGHGAVVGRDFVADQASELSAVAATIHALAASGLSARDALSSGQWPYPPEALAHAVERGFSHLPASVRRRLPLV